MRADARWPALLGVALVFGCRREPPIQAAEPSGPPTVRAPKVPVVPVGDILRRFPAYTNTSDRRSDSMDSPWKDGVTRVAGRAVLGDAGAFGLRDPTSDSTAVVTCVLVSAKLPLDGADVVVEGRLEVDRFISTIPPGVPLPQTVRFRVSLRECRIVEE